MQQQKQAQDRLSEWKQQYVQIPVPPTAKARVIAGIAQARQERLDRRSRLSLRRSGIAAAAVFLSFGIAVNTSPVIAKAMDSIPVIGSLARVVTLRTYTDSQTGMQADITVPQIRANAPANEDIQAYANQLIAQYEAEVAASMDDGHYAMTSDYQVISDNAHYVSIQINTVITQASGTQFVKIFTVDKATGETVSLGDYLQNDKNAQNTISENIRAQMQEQMAADENKQYFSVEEGGFSALDGTEDFYLDEAGDLVIVFDEYTVAPGYMGAVSFTIPKDILA